jgi:hypothetical protein
VLESGPSEAVNPRWDLRGECLGVSEICVGFASGRAQSKTLSKTRTGAGLSVVLVELQVHEELGDGLFFIR